VPPSLFEIGVREAEDLLRVALVPLERDVQPLVLGVLGRVADGFFTSANVITASLERRLVLVEVLDEGLDPPSYLKTCFFSPFGSVVDGLDRDAPVQERKLAEALAERVEVVARDGEDSGSA